jgi:hypothetical protein
VSAAAVRIGELRVWKLDRRIRAGSGRKNPNSRWFMNARRLLTTVAAAATIALAVRLVADERATAVSFAASGQQLNVLAGRGVALADFNGDGRLDAFVVNESSPDGSGHRVYFGDGHGRFTDGQTLDNASGYTAKPAVADINGDGALDVVAGDTVWVNDGHGRFSVLADAIERRDPASMSIVRLADVNGDGKQDLIAVAAWSGLRVYLNDGHGHFRDSRQRFGWGMMGALAVADVDGDGCADIVPAGWRSGKDAPSPNRVWLNDGRGYFHDSGQDLSQGDDHVHGVTLGDVNGDGRPDMVLAMTGTGRAGKVYLNEGKGRFRDSGQTIGHAWTHAAVLGDFDGDGAPDLFLVCGDPSTGTPNEVWLNDGRGRFRDSGPRMGSAFSWDAAAGDLNGDGKPDVMVANLRVADARKTPPVFGGVAAEVWLNATAKAVPAGERR